jgi:eukaryotic-like serine/threonine-protein kinase
MPEPQNQAVQAEWRGDLTGANIGRFTVRSRLGSGGMGEVYRADDSTLKRPVALKRLAPHLRTDQHFRERFFKEAQRASSLINQHIAGIYDVFEDKGEPFVVMEYVEGTTLRERLKLPITLEEALKIVHQCAEGLVAAHEKRLIHGDIKPENIMLARSGEVKILDFGVARRIPQKDPQAVTDSDVQPTGAGLAGTVAYMAPEVLLNQEADGRADIFSLGIVLYEVLAGKHPFLAPNLITTTDRILHEEPPPPSHANPSIPVEVDQVIHHMLAKNPSERYTSASELLTDLESFVARGKLTVPRPMKLPKVSGWVLALAALLLAILVPVFIPQVRQQLLRWSGRAPIPEQKSLVVLPFRAIGGGPEDQFYCDGMTETLTAKLTQLSGTHNLTVAPASEVRARDVTSAEQARRDLAGTLVLAGTVFRSGGKVRVNYELVDTKTLRQVRADTITANASDPFSVQDQVAEGAAQMLDLALRPAERQVMLAHGTEVADAYEFFLQGRGYLQNYDRSENIDRAIHAFNEALKQDADYSLAYAGLGEALWRKYEHTNEMRFVESAQEACHRALALDPKVTEAHVCLGTLYNGTGQYEKAVAEFEDVLKAEPTEDAAFRGLASGYENLGKIEEAKQTYQRAIRLRPQYWGGYNALGGFYARKARYSEAAEMFQQVTRLIPDSTLGYSNLGGVQILQGHYADAIPIFGRAVAIRPSADAYSNLGTAYFYLRQFADSVRSYKESLQLNDKYYVVWGNLGDAYHWSPDEKLRATEAYQKAISLAEQSLRVNPRDATALGYLSYYDAMLQAREPALSFLSRALAIAPGNPELLFNAALAYNQVGDTNRAFVYLKKALDAGYYPALMRDSPILDKLRRNPQFGIVLNGK